MRSPYSRVPGGGGGMYTGSPFLPGGREGVSASGNSLGSSGIFYLRRLFKTKMMELKVPRMNMTPAAALKNRVSLSHLPPGCCV